MSYYAKIFNIMIASPSDVQPERNIIREVVHEWNAIHSDVRRIVLLPVGWETHVSPEMGNRPQEIINTKILEKCDLLVGVFWTRIGTDTGKYPSGTVEEIEKHIGSGKPVMLYFSNKPAHLDNVDTEQYAKMREFKISCQSRGLYETYSDLNDFKDKFFRQLQIKVNEDSFFTIPNTGLEKDTVTAESGLSIPTLSKEALFMLSQVCKDSSGEILHVTTIGGTSIQIGGKNMIPDQSRRVVAKWEAALDELTRNNLIVDSLNDGEVFEITEKGYQIAEILNL